MNKEDFRILFMGTPEFAVASLEALHQAGFNIVGVVTAPDKPAGRGLKLTPSPVKVAAKQLNLHVLQPEKLKSPEFLQQIASLKPDLGIVVAFRMLPEVVWKAPRLGTFNLHASLLPKYRGAAPIQWAIANGEKTTGVSTFFLKHEIDTGNLLMAEEEPIYDDDTGGTLYQRLMTKGAALVVKTAQAILDNNYTETPQDLSQLTPQAPKIGKETGWIDFNLTAQQIYNLVRAFNPFPGTYVYWQDKMLKIWKTAPFISNSNINLRPGETYSADRQLLVGTADGILEILELQPEGKKSMPAADFLRGYKLQNGTLLKGKNTTTA
jgi:methionyl-tRNA formyltransferase